MIRLHELSVGIFLALLTVPSAATLTKPEAASVAFTASGPAGLKIQGSTQALDVSEDGERIVVTVPLSTLQTGIELRDRHMKEKYLEVARYPTATLSILRSSLKLDAAAPSTGDVTGTLTLHGKSKGVSVHYDAARAQAVVSVRGTFGLNINDFGIAVPSYLGVTVKPTVDIAASFRIAGI